MHPNNARKQKLTKFFVYVLVLGLLMTYVPLLFSSTPQDQTASNNPPQQAADLSASATQNAAATNTTTTAKPNDKPALPESFTGLDKEDQSLNDLNKSLQ
jgi:hypothetical protein